MQSKLKYSLGWVEAGLYLGGVALMAIFFLLRFEGERQRQAGIAAFTSSAAQQITIPGSAQSDGITATVSPPDQSLWAEKRIREYEESLAVEADPPLAVMTIDKLGIQVPVYNGADDFNLNRGVARIKGTAAVDAVGNLGVAGHRDGFFRGLKDIEVGDEIELLDPEDVWVLAPTDEKTLTLVTCYPFYYVGHAPKRFIVQATAEHFLSDN